MRSDRHWKLWMLIPTCQDRLFWQGVTCEKRLGFCKCPLFREGSYPVKRCGCGVGDFRPYNTASSGQTVREANKLSEYIASCMKQEYIACVVSIKCTVVVSSCSRKNICSAHQFIDIRYIHCSHTCLFVVCWVFFSNGVYFCIHNSSKKFAKNCLAL